MIRIVLLTVVVIIDWILKIFCPLLVPPPPEGGGEAGISVLDFF